MTSAPGRTRTCAHGSGEGCCSLLTSANALQSRPPGRVWGATRKPGQAPVPHGVVAVRLRRSSWAPNLAPATAYRAACPSARASPCLPAWPTMLAGGAGAFPSVASLARYPGLAGRAVRTCLAGWRPRVSSACVTWTSRVSSVMQLRNWTAVRVAGRRSAGSGRNASRWVVAFRVGAAARVSLTEVVLPGCQLAWCPDPPGAWICGRSGRPRCEARAGPGEDALYRTHIWSSRGPEMGDSW
jgi:hypothetical protein